MYNMYIKTVCSRKKNQYILNFRVPSSCFYFHAFNNPTLYMQKVKKKSRGIFETQSLESWQVLEKLFSTEEHMQVQSRTGPNVWGSKRSLLTDRLLHPLQMQYRNLTSQSLVNSQTRSCLVINSQVWAREGFTEYDHAPVDNKQSIYHVSVLRREL